MDLAGEIVDGERIRRNRIDSAVAAAAAFLAGPTRRRRSAKNRKADRDADVVEAAYRVFAGDEPGRWELEARILAGQSDAEIGARCGLPENVVSAYEAVFFDVRPCTAIDYLLSQVVGPGVWCGFGNCEVRQFWAWCGRDALGIVFRPTFAAMLLPGDLTSVCQ